MHWSEKFEDIYKLNGCEYTSTEIRVERGRSARVFFVEKRLDGRVLFMEYRGWVEDAASSRFFPRECIGQDENDRTLSVPRPRLHRQAVFVAERYYRAQLRCVNSEHVHFPQKTNRGLGQLGI